MVSALRPLGLDNGDYAVALDTQDAASFSGAVTLANLDSEVSFISGVTSGGTAAATSYWTGISDTDPHQWTTAAGSAGPSASGTLTLAYTFGSNFTTTEMATFKEALSLWSAVANVNFVAAAGVRVADIVLLRGDDGAAFTQATWSSAGSNGVGSIEPTATISIDTSVHGFDLSGSFTDSQGYGLATVLHEIGHALGLGHAGDYNGSVNASTQQFSQYDTRLWSIMSYIEPYDSAAQYYYSYAVAGTDWGYSQTSTTWMPADILAVQRLYGASTSSVLSGGQTFGFNTNVATSIRPFFDFSVNTAPIITLYDSGTGNTLDLSGYTSGATVDLRAGRFSSFDGLVNNLGIAFGTRIDTAIGSTGGDAFYVNADSNSIIGKGSGNTVYFSGVMAAYVVAGDATDATVTRGTTVDLLSDIDRLVFSDGTVTLSCFAAGTPILTETGEVAVEELRVGDRVATLFRGPAAIHWIGRRRVEFARHPLGDGARPLCVRAGALGDAMPRRDVWLSADHAVLVDGVLVPIGFLDNASSILRDRSSSAVTYYHLELDAHDAVWAAGVAAETFRDTGNRASFLSEPVVALHPAFLPSGDGTCCAPLLTGGAALDAIRARLWRRATALGYAGGGEQEVVLDREGEHTVTLPAGHERLRLLSASASPGIERRALGALIAGISIDGAAMMLSDARLTGGFHPVERHGATAVRWTGGAAVIEFGKAADRRDVVLRVAAIATALAA